MLNILLVLAVFLVVVLYVSINLESDRWLGNWVASLVASDQPLWLLACELPDKHLLIKHEQHDSGPYAVVQLPVYMK